MHFYILSFKNLKIKVVQGILSRVNRPIGHPLRKVILFRKLLQFAFLI